MDGDPQSNSTNLVVKGIIALQAMSKIADAALHKDDAARYSVKWNISQTSDMKLIPIVAPR